MWITKWSNKNKVIKTTNVRVFLFKLIYIRQKNNAMLIIPGDNTADFRVSVCPILRNMDDDLDESAVTGANRKGVVWNFFKVSQDDDTHAKCNLCGASCSRGSRLPKKHAVTLATKTGDDADVVKYLVIIVSNVFILFYGF